MDGAKLLCYWSWTNFFVCWLTENESPSTTFKFSTQSHQSLFVFSFTHVRIFCFPLIFMYICNSSFWMVGWTSNLKASLQDLETWWACFTISWQLQKKMINLLSEKNSRLVNNASTTSLFLVVWWLLSHTVTAVCLQPKPEWGQASV